MRKVLVAGATGLLGRTVAQLLRDRRYEVRAFSRDPARARALQAITNDTVIGDATRARDMDGVMEGVDAVISCLGAPVSFTWKERRSFYTVDTTANRNIIRAAVDARVSRFVYVSVHVQPAYAGTTYIRAHEAVVEELGRSGLSAAVVRPTGVFPIFDPFIAMARHGIAFIPGDGTARTNPVHQLDVAEACVDALAGEEDLSFSIGGPDIFTREEIIELAFEAVKKRPQIVHVPRALALTGGTVIRPLHPRIGETIDFAARVFTSECVAPRQGRRRLVDHFTRIASTG